MALDSTPPNDERAASAAEESAGGQIPEESFFGFVFVFAFLWAMFLMGFDFVLYVVNPKPVLGTGFVNEVLCVPMLLLPFHVVAFGLGVMTWTGLRNEGKGWSKPYDGHGAIEVADRSSLRMPGVSAGACTCIALAVCAIPIASGAWAISGDPPSLGAMAVAWLILILIAALVHHETAGRIAAGTFDASVDRATGTLTLPATLVEPHAATIAPAEFQAVDLVSKSDVEHGRLHSVVVTWGGPDGTSSSVTFRKWTAKERAEEIAHWIRSKMGVAL